MTLDTRMYVHDPIDHKALFDHCNTLIGAVSPVSTDSQDETWRKGESFVEPGNPWSIRNRLGQGFCALLDISYRPNAPLRTDEQAAEHDDEICDEDCGGDWHPPACWIEVSLDTAYGYRGDNGEGCGDLHARLVGELGLWLDGQGIGWSWMNEFTGEVHGGGSRYRELVGLASGGFEATAWFQTTVLPAIERDLRGGASDE